MVYSLVITYNRNINEKIVEFAKKHGVFPVIFDNSSETETKKYNKEFCEKNNIAYESFGENKGLPRAYNFVVKKYLKDDDWIIILDQDTAVTDEYFDEVSKIIKQPNKQCYFATFKYGKNKYGPKIFKNHNKVSAKKIKTLKHLDGFLVGINSCTLISKTVFDKVGYFNEDLFMDYVDVDFCVRLAENGIQSETIDVLIKQEFFSKSKNNFKTVKRRYANQLMDLSIFTKTLNSSWVSKTVYQLKERIKFRILYSLKNNIFWFVPLCFVRKRHINETH